MEDQKNTDTKKALWVSEEKHRIAKINAAKLGITLQEYVEKYLTQPKPKNDGTTNDK